MEMNKHKNGRSLTFNVCSSVFVVTTLLLIPAAAEDSNNIDVDTDDYNYDSSQRIWYPRALIEAARLRDQSQQEFRPTARVDVGLAGRTRQVGLRSPRLAQLVADVHPPYQSRKLVIRDSYYPLNNATVNTKDYPPQANHKRAMRRQSSNYIVSPLSGQIIEVGEDLQDVLAELSSDYKSKSPLSTITPKVVDSDDSGYLNNDCSAIRSRVQLAKDEYDKISGKLMRSCRGLVEVNRCEGSCSSTVQPSIKSPTGFRKVSEEFNLFYSSSIH